MPNNEFPFGTKAETLERLAPLVRQAEVLDLVYFPVADWVADPAAVLERLAAGFGDQALAVRSSATGEDTAERSMAGAFMSRLGVDGSDRQALETAIADVVASYSGNPNDQILVQPMLDNVAVSGVIMTHDLQRGSPFYVIEYDDESGKTDSITGGTHVNKAVLVFRGCDDKYLVSERVLRMLSLARELEEICDHVGIIENGQLVFSGTLDEIHHRLGVHNKVRVRINVDHDRAIELLCALPQIDDVKRLGEEISVIFKEGQSGDGLIARTLVQGGVDVIALTPERVKLDEAFLQLTKGVVH